MGSEGQQDIEMAILTALLKGILVLVDYFFYKSKVREATFPEILDYLILHSNNTPTKYRLS